MKKFEYIILNFDLYKNDVMVSFCDHDETFHNIKSINDRIDFVNSLGNLGWEMISWEISAIFKREKE